MKLAVLAFLALGVAATANAQVYCWNTKDGKRQCGDTPPPGVKATAIGGAPSPSAPPSPARDAAGKEAKKSGPLTPAEQEQEFRKRQLAAQKAREKERAEQEQAQAKRENCENARATLRTLESGQRIARTGKDGERYYLDEQQVAHETERARQIVQKSCN
jgi:hypothetical protein